MKLRNLVLGMMTCAALAACSNEDLVDNNGSNQDVNTVKYVTVGINFPKSESRAAGFEAGIAEEYNVGKALFVFFSESGSYLTQSEMTPTGWTQQADNSRVATVQIKTETKPYSVVVILNPTTKISVVPGITVESLKKAIAAESADYAADNAFLMTNSSYISGNKAVYDVVIPASAITETASDKGTPVNIYVERAAARVDVNFTEAFKANMQGNVYTYKDANDNTFSIAFDGWGLNATNKTFKPLKEIDATWTGNWVGTNRTFWGIDNNYTNGNYPKDHTEVAAGNSLKYISVDDTRVEFGGKQYCLENTLNAGLQTNNAAYTHVLIAAQFKLGEATQYADVYRFEAKYWTLAKLQTELANRLAAYSTSNASDVKVTPAQVLLNVVEVNKTKAIVTVTLAAGVKLYKGTAEVPFTQDLATNNNNIYKYTDGKCYYYVPIKHMVNGQSQDGAYGVVRNHWYNLTISNLSGIGNPIDPTIPVIPTDPEGDKSWFINATVDILPWNKMPDQEVDLGK